MKTLDAIEMIVCSSLLAANAAEEYADPVEAADAAPDALVQAWTPVDDADVHAPFVTPKAGAQQEVTWLGVSTEEAPALLVSQMKLDPGVGLVVAYVAEDSPAAKAGLAKDDLLVGFDDQSLVHPAQLRKLVQSREAEETVKLQYYRSGEKQTLRVELGKTDRGPFGNAGVYGEQFPGPGRPRPVIPGTGMAKGRQQGMMSYGESMERYKGEQERIQQQVRRAMEHAQQAMANAKAQVHSGYSTQQEHEEAHQTHSISVGEGARMDPFADQHSAITVRSRTDSSKSLVRTDDTGTYVLVRNPKLRLTVHDEEGTLAFDGEIETEEQQAEVPGDIWETVEPLVEKMNGSD